VTEIHQDAAIPGIPGTPEDHQETPAHLDLKTILRLIQRTWPYIRPQLLHLIAFVTINFLGGLIFLGTMFLASDLFSNKILIGEPLQPMQAVILNLDDSYVTTGEEGELMTVAQRRTTRDRLIILFAITALILFAFSAITPYYAVWVYQRINQHLRVTMLERAEHLSLKYHSHARTGDMIYRVYQDSAMITRVVEILVITPLRILATILFAVVVLAFFSPWLGLLCLVTAAPLIWLVAWFTPRIQRHSRLARERNSNLTSRIQEVFSAIKVVKANGSEASVIARFNHDSIKALDAAYQFRQQLILMSVSVAVITMLMVLLIEYLMAGWTITEATTYLGGVVALVGFATWNLGAYQAASSRIDEATGQTFELIGIWGAAQDLVVGLDRAFFLLDLEPEVTEAEHPLPFPEPIREVSWRSASFAYESGRPVLNGVNLAAHAGTITAIVGSTGSGKSTMMSMLLRLYDPDEGDLLINDTNLKEINLSQLKTHIAIALQQNVLFAATVAENIGYATRGASRAAIESAATVACANTFIEEMSRSYDTELGERGGKLSTGQRQRLSIARAIVRDTPILILDEPTASLDAETEHQVLANLAEWGRERIVFLITHRLSTIRNADTIAFLEDGRIVETGSHDELMQMPDGRYRRFVQAETSGSDTP
jgi:ATP-binding cassette subfamily B protein